MAIFPYLTFAGNCRDAMEYYRECLGGGQLNFQTIGDSPLGESLPMSMKRGILHAELRHRDMTIMGTDLVMDGGLSKGNAVSLLLDCSSEIELAERYRQLSRQAKHCGPVERTHWGAVFGTIEDRYGNHWLLHFQPLK